MKKIYLSLICLISLPALGEVSLDKKLDELSIPSDRVTPILSKDQLSVVNTRYSSLNNRHELTMAGANNFTSESHLDTKQVFATYRYHINSNWGVGLRYSVYNNELTSSGKKLFDDEKMLPDTDFAFKATEVMLSYNTIYGKLRWSKDQVVYFDQYFTLGYGKVDLASGLQDMYSLDIGMAFWLGKHMSTRLGVKNEFYTQNKLSGDDSTMNAMGYLEFGYLFGEGNRG